MKVKLVNSTKHHPLDVLVASARTCSMQKPLTPHQVQRRVKTKGPKKRNGLAEKVFDSGHHTTLEHNVFTFLVEGISRQALWSFLHSHPFYNSSQQSQRYVTMSANGLAIPKSLSSQNKRDFQKMATKQFIAYNKINELLLPFALGELQNRFPHLKKSEYEKKATNLAQKKVQEIGRYILPVATTANLYHTINALTLHRYHRLQHWFSESQEVSTMVNKMCACVESQFPGFFDTLVTDPIPLEETPEFEFLSQRSQMQDNRETSQFKQEFDRVLGDHPAKLIGYMNNAEGLLANAVREVLGISKGTLNDIEAIALILDSRKNSHIGQTLNVKMMTPINKALAHAVYSFKVRLSHTADSQAQRHRTVPASRPILGAQFTEEPDYIVPQLLHNNQKALDLYHSIMQETWQTVNNLLNNKIEIDEAVYLLPNATTIRYTETANLFALHHLMIERLCLNSQEEIFYLNMAKAKQIRNVHPNIGKFLDAPCILRQNAKIIPNCKEGIRFCGVPLWREGTVFGYNRNTI